MKPDNHIKIPRKKLGVLMVNLGTPEKTDFINMWKYLREFLSDRRRTEVGRLYGIENTTEKLKKVIEKVKKEGLF